MADNISPETFLSRAIAIVNVKDPVIDKERTEFIYNYFKKSESNPTNESINLDDSINSENRKTIPQYVNVKFKNITESSNLNNIAKEADREIVKKIKKSLSRGEIRLDSVVLEGGMSNFYFYGLTMVDNFSDVAIHDAAIAASIVTQDINSTEGETTQTMTEKYINRLASQESNNSAFNPSLIRDFVNDLSKQSVSLPSPTKKVNAQKYNSFHISLNSMFIDDIVKSSLDDTCHVFADELINLASVTSNLQNNALDLLHSSLSEPVVSESDFSCNLRAGVLLEDFIFVHTDPSPDDIEELAKEDSVLHHVGFVIEKIEFFKGEKKIFKPILVSNIETNGDYIDTEIRYGARYVYRIRNLFAVIYTFFNSVNNATGLDQLIRGPFLIASNGDNVEINCIETINPDPPNNLKFAIDTKSESLRVSWIFPPNTQQDIKGFQVFRRDSVEKPFTLVAEIDFNDLPEEYRPILRETAPPVDFYRYEKEGAPVVVRMFYDKEFSYDKKYIYAIASVDAHGMTSKLSSQLSVKYSTYLNKLVVNKVSRPGAPKAYPNIFLNKDVFSDAIRVSRKNRMSVFFNPEYSKVYSETQDGTKNYKNFIVSTSNNKPTYKLTFLNLDLQKNTTVDIKIKDTSNLGELVDPNSFDPDNLSFNLIDLSNN